MSDEHDDELGNLNGRDVALPPDLAARSRHHEEVVPVPVRFKSANGRVSEGWEWKERWGEMWR